MTDIVTEIRFWAQVMTDSERTVICPPDLESRCKGYVDARGLSGLIKVRAERWCPDGKILVFNTHAIAATIAQANQRPFRMFA